MPDQSKPGRDLAVIALVSSTVLIFEIAITRLLSVVLWYHFAFLAISLAMLGLGAPGVWQFVRRPRRDSLPKLLNSAAAAIPLSVTATVKSGAWLVEFPSIRVAVIVVALLVPLILLGAVICLLLLEARGRAIGAMYGCDLLGAAVGASAVVPLMSVLSTPHLLAALGFLPLVAVVLVRQRPTKAGVVVGILLASALLWGEPFRVRQSKVYQELPFGVLYEKWTPTARLTVFPDVFWIPDARQAFGWGFGSRYRPRPIEQLWVEQDGSAGTPITRLPSALSELEHLKFDVTSVGYQLRPPRRACVIGAGGGRDILTALQAGAEYVDAVELNPAMIHAVSDVFGEFSGDVYHLPGVHAHASEGRSFLSRTGDDYDLIQISLTDSWAATAAGAYALSENFLYTKEAIRLYLDRLTPQGVLSISRWMSGGKQMETLRMALLIRAALGDAGVSNPLSRVAVVQGGQIGTVLVSATPLDRAELSRLDRIGAQRGFARHWPPHPETYKTSLVARVLQEGASSLEQSGLYVSPPTDDRPFFFQSVRAFSLVDPDLLEKLSINDRAARLPRLLLGIVGVLTAVLFFAPFFFTPGLTRGPPLWRGSLYFVSVGVGFMLVEIPLIQRTILYLGHPSYATTVVLFTLLLGSGLGSWVAGRCGTPRLTRLRWLLPAGVAVLTVALDSLTQPTLGWPAAGRIALTTAAIGPLGFLMGFAFPVGMIRFGEFGRAWFWAVNGASGVLASVAAIALAAYVGFSGVIWLGVGCYLLAGLFLGSPSLEPENSSG
jgi:hypothetical protein